MNAATFDNAYVNAAGSHRYYSWKKKTTIDRNEFYICKQDMICQRKCCPGQIKKYMKLKFIHDINASFNRV